MFFGCEEEIKILKELKNNSKSLNDLGFVCKVGNIIWNQNRNILTAEKENNVKLVYSSSLNNGVLTEEIRNKNKPDYIIGKEGNTNCVLLVNRGYGKGKFKLNYSIMTGEYPYLVENHVIVIKSKDNPTIENYKKLVNSFGDPRALKFIELYFKNSSLNINELNYIIPIYIN